MEFLNRWSNVPYLVLLGLVGVVTILQLLGHDQDHDHDHDHHGGVGDLPLTVRFSVFALITGGVGLLFNRFDHELAGIVPALSLGFVAQHATGRLATKLFGKIEASKTSRASLVGEVAKVVSSTADHRFGEISVRGEDGDDVLVHARVLQPHAPLPYGSAALIVSYEPTADIFVVEALDSERLG